MPPYLHWVGRERELDSNPPDANVVHTRAGALVKWLWEETHVPKVVGSNPGTICWMDMTFFHIDLLLKLYCLFEKTENK